MIKIALDVMGGDNCPDCNIDGALLAVEKNRDITVRLYGPRTVIEQKLNGRSYDRDRIEIIDAPEVITLDETPVKAIREKKLSSIVLAINDVRDKAADAFVSAGSSGAVLAAGQLKIGRIAGVQRPPLAFLLPNIKGVSLFLDCGANIDAKPEWLCQFARIGSIYMEKVLGVKNPLVKLVNVGLEDEKGNLLTKSARAMIDKLPALNFGGYIESREIPYGGADVIVADAFTGNAILKMYEGVSSALIQVISSALKNGDLRTKLGAAMIKPALKSTLKTFSASEYGGAPLLGLKGLVVKCHGNAGAREISNALLQCGSYLQAGIDSMIGDAMENDAQFLS